MNQSEMPEICFVISPIGELDSETRKRSDKVLRFIIKPCAEKFGYESIRADQISEPGIITSQVIQKIVDSELVIADLTDKNPNVFYELALRHAIKRPLIQIISKDDIIPFDIAATRVIKFDILDLESVEKAKDEICNQIIAIKSGRIEFDNPISISFDIKKLNESGNPEQRSIADIMQSLSEIRGLVTSLENNSNKVTSVLSVDYFTNILKSAVHKIITIDPQEQTVEFYEYIIKELVRITEKMNKSIEKLPLDFDPTSFTNISECIDLLVQRSKRFLEIAKYYNDGQHRSK